MFLQNGLQELLDKDKVETTDIIIVSKIDEPTINKKWLAFRVEMTNGAHRAMTMTMCRIVAEYGDRRYQTKQPPCTGSLYRHPGGEQMIRHEHSEIYERRHHLYTEMKSVSVGYEQFKYVEILEDSSDILT